MACPFPYSPAKLSVVAGTILGGLAGWLLTPMIWLPFGPLRWLTFLLASVAQESGYTTTAVGDDGMSVGSLQWWAPTWSATTGRPLEDRSSAYLSAYYAPRMVTDALHTDGRWLPYLMAPVYGFAAFRHLWTHGGGQSSADTLGSAWAEMRLEGQSWTAFLMWRGLTLFPLLLLLPVLVMPMRALRRRR